MIRQNIFIDNNNVGNLTGYLENFVDPAARLEKDRLIQKNRLKIFTLSRQVKGRKIIYKYSTSTSLSR